MDLLEEIGFTQNEAKVYRALLDSGPSSAGGIIAKTGLHRAVVYDTLGRLQEKALVASVTKDNRKMFEAGSPERLRAILKEKEEKLERLIPQLAVRSPLSLSVKVHEGKEGLKTIGEDILRSKPKEVVSLGQGGETYELIPSFLDFYHRERLRLGIKDRLLYRDNEITRARAKKLGVLPDTSIRFLPKSVSTPSAIVIYNDRTALFLISEQKNPFVIFIENKELADSLREYFELLWAASEKNL